MLFCMASRGHRASPPRVTQGFLPGKLRCCVCLHTHDTHAHTTHTYAQHTHTKCTNTLRMHIHNPPTDSLPWRRKTASSPRENVKMRQTRTAPTAPPLLAPSTRGASGEAGCLPRAPGRKPTCSFSPVVCLRMMTHGSHAAAFLHEPQDFHSHGSGLGSEESQFCSRGPQPEVTCTHQGGQAAPAEPPSCCGLSTKFLKDAACHPRRRD